MSLADWLSPDPDLVEAVDNYRETCLSVYEQDPNRILEDLRKEYSIAEGGYGRKQVQELLQNGADALREAPGRLAVHLTHNCLYVANQGKPFTGEGLRGILYAHLSEKTGEEIGRFGLGFKSIAGISANPQIYSQSVSFTFDRSSTHQTVNERIDSTLTFDDVPALRIAWPIEPVQEFEDDPILRSLAKWAATVVKVPLFQGAARDLDKEIQEFDESFCLFVPAVRELSIKSEISDTYKTYTVMRSGEGRRQVELRDSEGQTSHWYVVSRKHVPSESALENAGRTARRETVDVSWAVPLEGKVKVGQLSAYFPIKSEVSLSGKLNAPWKLSDDRIDLIEGAFNEEILANVVPELVSEARQFLGAKDPGRYIDILPARGRELRSWADGVINEPIFRKLRSVRSLPNATGEMRSPNTLRMTPQIIPNYVAQEWVEKALSTEDWVHPDCTSTQERRSKTLRLMGGKTRDELHGLHEWLESFSVGDGGTATPDRSITALHAVNTLQDEAEIRLIEEIADVARSSRIVLLESGALARPRRGQAVLRSNEGDRGENFVHPEVASDEKAKRTLIELGVAESEDTGKIGDIITQLRIASELQSDDWWDNAWSIFRSTSHDELIRELSTNLVGEVSKFIKVKTLGGSWVYPNGQYLPGKLLKPNQEDSSLLIDPEFHALDYDFLKFLGITETPFLSMNHVSERWVRDYHKAHLEEFGIALQLNKRNWDEAKLDPLVLMGPLDDLAQFSPANRARLTKYVLERSYDSTAKIRSSKNALVHEAFHPVLWKIVQDGLLKTTIGYSPISEAFLSSSVDEELHDVLPVVTDLELHVDLLKALPFRGDLTELSERDFERLVLFHKAADDEGLVGKVYGWYCYLFTESVPSRLTVKVADQWKSVEPTKVAVTADPLEERNLEKFGVPTLPVPSLQDVELLNTHWELLTFDEIPVDVQFVPSGDRQPLLFVFENLLSLAADLDDDSVIDQLHSLEFQPCESLDLVSELPGLPRSRESVTRAVRDNVVYVVGQSTRTKLAGVLEALNIDVDDYRFDQLVEESESRQLSMAKSEVRAAETDADRLSIMFTDDEIVSQIPSQGLEYAKSKDGIAPSGSTLAQICIDMFGPAALEKLCRRKQTLSVGIPPKNWKGSYTTRKWVRELGFSDEWAGRKGATRNTPNEVVSGPAEPGTFHDYQHAVSLNLKRMLRGESPHRGLITLPTGAGKTRVAVQTIIESISDGEMDRDGVPFNGPILWLVNNEELCEQAIDAWSYLWSAVGRPNTALTVSRHFGTYNAEEEPNGVQVVVATYQKAGGSTEKREYDWLKETPLVVIDEAHSALAPTYTKILNWTGRSARERDKLLLGLTATPYSGRSDSERTEQLLKRFDNNILDEGVFGDEQPMIRLQNDRVLSHVTMEIIRTDSAIELTDQEREEFEKSTWLPRQKEKALGEDLERTLRIVDSIKSKPSDWSIIVFATSVENAETIAAMLTLDGIPSAAISANTPDSERALALERFRSKELRVLTNYGVLSQGFDAPKTDAVYITRPTQSEVRYQQMIGRGLRGPKNGGTEDVHLVNVLDNIREFPLSINYKPFEKLAESIDGN
ncbi:DEAD/DEAH box helicase [Corynebacterium sp. Marseille-P4321]|uniref:DEAD/DEAH box helicase n=1 Tax=Corynebacterium sp. Marseille-P4321 TaxID=2736603 RepID=UPI00158D5004|nr:DEAD/DEAH box helicase [Corynebacterium sp. Marseille-P4321]